MSNDSPLSGIGLRLFAVFLMTAMSAVVHGAAETVSVGQIIFWRSFIALLPICAYMAWKAEFPKAIGTRYPRLHLTRGLFGAFSMALSFISLAYLPVANAQALAYLAPVITLPMASWMLREKLGPRLIVAVSLGFGGVVAMLWQAMEMPGEGAVIGALAGIGYAVTMAFVRVHIKNMTATERPSTIAFWFAVVCSVVGLLTLPFGWSVPDAGTLTLLCLAGLLGGTGHIAAVEAQARAPVSTLAPFEFTGLIWALGFDMVLFNTAPDHWGLIGAVLITLAGIVVSLQPSGKKQAA